MNELNPVLQKFVEWLKLTDEEKIKQGLPLTQREFAIIHDVSAPQLSEWKRELDLQPAKPGDVRALFDHIIAESLKPRCSPTLARLAWDITHPKEEVEKGEGLTADELIDVGIKFRDRTITEYKSSGICPVCGQRNPLYEEPHLDTGREQQQEDSVATVAVPD